MLLFFLKLVSFAGFQRGNKWLLFLKWNSFSHKFHCSNPIGKRALSSLCLVSHFLPFFPNNRRAGFEQRPFNSSLHQISSNTTAIPKCLVACYLRLFLRQRTMTTVMRRARLPPTPSTTHRGNGISGSGAIPQASVFTTHAS